MIRLAEVFRQFLPAYDMHYRRSAHGQSLPTN